MIPKKIIWIAVTTAFAAILVFIPLYSVTGRSEDGLLRTRASVNLFRIKHGPYAEYTQKNEKVLEGRYFLGQYDGVWKWFSAQSIKPSEACRYAGKTSECRSFYDDGKTRDILLLRAAKPRHISDMFFNSARSVRETAYRAGSPQGEYRRFYRSGAVMTEGRYENGDPVGRWTSYGKNGKIKMTRDYEGELHARQVTIKTFFSGGQVASQSLEGSSLAARNRTDVQYYESGQTFFKMKLQGGIPEEIAFYDPSGVSLVYCDADEFGVYCSLDSEAGTGATRLVRADYPSGNRALEIGAEGGRLNGKMTRYYENGEVMGYFTFNHGALDGESSFFNEDGTVEAKKLFLKWKLVEAVYPEQYFG